MLMMLAGLAALTAGSAWLTERVDRPRRRSERIAAAGGGANEKGDRR